MYKDALLQFKNDIPKQCICEGQVHITILASEYKDTYYTLLIYFTGSVFLVANTIYWCSSNIMSPFTQWIKINGLLTVLIGLKIFLHTLYIMINLTLQIKWIRRKNRIYYILLPWNNSFIGLHLQSVHTILLMISYKTKQNFLIF